MKIKYKFLMWSIFAVYMIFRNPIKSFLTDFLNNLQEVAEKRISD